MVRSGALAVVLVLAATIVALLAGSAAAVSCGQVVSFLRPCLPYVKGQAAALLPGCCSGVKSLNSAAQTTTDRQAACNCILSQVSGISGIQGGLLSGLPGSCGVQLPFPVSASTDCSSSLGLFLPDSSLVRRTNGHAPDGTPIAGGGSGEYLTPSTFCLRSAGNRKLPVILQFHGGAFVAGSNPSDANDFFCRRIGKLLGAIVVSVGYRLAPESMYPAAFDDVVKVLDQLFGEAGESGLVK